MPTVSIGELTTLVTAALRTSGASESQARSAARYLVAADAQGLATHGVARVPTYCSHLKSGRAKGAAVPRVVKDAGAACLIDADTGLGIAEKYAAAGANVVLNGLGNREDIEHLRVRLETDHEVTVRYDAADMSDAAAIEAMIAKACEAFGAIDVLVNNAGIQHVAPIDEFPPEKWEAIIAVNLVASFHTIRHAVAAMKARKWGRIVNIASAHALVASPYKSAYVAAKHGLAGLTKTVALEVAAHGVTCNAICPGYVRTPLVEKQIPDTARARGISEEEVVRDVILSAQPTKQFVTIEQVASLAAYLAGDDAASINGALLSIDGGWTAQ